MKKHLLILFAALLPLVASAQTKVEIDGIWYNLIKKVKTAEVTYKGEYAHSYDEYYGSITIPATVTYGGVTYSVTSIGDDAFCNCNLTAITIPESVTSIGDDAFSCCSNLTTINIPKGVTSIANSAFEGCSSLTSITLPKGVTSIGERAFYECSSLTSITLPESVTSIGDEAFRDCSSLKSITLPESVTSIGERAFERCSSLTAINIPEGVTSIGGYAFWGCSSLTAITIPKSVTSIGSYAFSGCNHLTAINIPEGVTSIGNSAFSGCSRLTAVHISSIEAWYKISFYNNDSNPLYYAHNLYLNGELVTELVIPEGVTSIGANAFCGCSSLTAITIPESVTSIRGHAFSGCSRLTAITIPESVTSIGDGAFEGCSSLTAITLPESVTSIGESAFSGCTSLTAINIPEGVTSIGRSVFSDCSRLTSITLPESLTSIGESAFSGCTSLTAITIPEGVTSIEWSAFSGCTSLTAINIPEGVTSIRESAFSGCTSLTAITLPEGVTSIGDNAFLDCSSLTAITLPESVTSIGSSAFLDCSSLTAITIPEGVTSIEWNAFAGCSSLTAITLPESVTSIGDCAFYGCRSLTTIMLPKSVEYIRRGAFANCSGLTDVYCYAEKVPSTDSDAFNGSYIKYVTLHVPTSAVNRYKTTAPWSGFGKYEVIMFAANAQQLQTGDTFKYTNSEGVVKTYKVVGENLIENPSFDNGTTGWVGGAGGALSNTEVNYSGGVDGGAYIRPTSHSGKGDNNSIGTAWDVEVGKTYVFSFFMKNQTNTAAESPAGDGYIKVSMSNTYRDETLVLQPLPHVDADLAWTQNTWVVTAEYTSLALCARWLGGDKCFDAFILAEVEEAADTKELEDLLAQCAEWMDYFGDDAKEYDTFNAVVEKGQALVDGGEFTAADLNAMVHELKEALLDFRVANASDENPVDVTDRYIKNTKFDNSWTGWTVVNAAVDNGMNIRNFAYFEPGLNPVAEINGIPSAESSISQTVYNLPMGYYRFTVQAVMSHSVDVNNPEDKSGAIIFCNGSELDMVTKEQTAVGAANDASYPETFTIEGEVSADSMVVGFKGLTSASFSYVAIDNVRLYYIGEPHSTITYIVDGKLYHQESIKHGSTITLPEAPTKEGYTFSGWSEVPEIMPTHDITVNATFTINSYNVTFKIGDEIISSETLEYGAAVVAPEAPEKEGHTFNGWGEVAENVPANDVTYEGSYSVNSYLLTIAIDGEMVESDSIAYGTTITLPEAPTKEGYTFSGWSEVPETMPAEDVNISGTFIINKYLVTFKIGDEVIASDSLEYGATIVTPEAPEKEGHTFNGWGEVAENVPANDVTYEGSYSVNSYLLTIAIDGEIVESDSIAYGTTITLPEAPTKEGYTFSGWSEVPETMPAKDVTVTGSFTVNSYTLTYTVDGKEYKKETVAYGTQLTAIDAPTKEGHTFSGWSEVPVTMPAKDVTISGVFTINTYLVTFKIGDEVIASDSLTYGAAIVAPEAPEKEGYTFDGWGEVAETVPAGDVTYEGSYSANIYKVYYYVGEELVHTAEVIYGEAIPEYIYEPTEEGYTFLGWLGETYETMPAHDVTYTANIESGINQITINNGQLNIYDLMGRKVTDTENLKGGIYIIDGKKVIIK